MVGVQQTVWDRLKLLWDDPTSTVRDHLNVVSADFVDDDRFWGPIVNMNVEPVPPDPPAITDFTDNGGGQVSVAFDAPADQGTGPVRSYRVTYYSSDGGPSNSVTGTSSPIMVTGLASGEYVFYVSATNAAGPSEPSDQLRVDVDEGGPSVPPTIIGVPAPGVVGRKYNTGFSALGTPPVFFTLVSGQVPPGMTLGNTGFLSGTPAQAGTFQLEVQASNPYGSDQATAQVVISSTTAAPRPETGRQRARAKICTKGENDRPECATRLLFGPFPGLKDRAAVSLVRGPVTYATARYRELTLRRRCEPPLENPTGLMESEPPCEVPFGRYTLVLRRDHHSIFVPVTVH
jgi:hypothetical protein